HSGCIGNGMLSIFERLKRHSAAKFGMARAYNASIALMKYQALIKSCGQIVEKSSGKIDRTGTERRSWIVCRNWQHPCRCAGCVLLQEFQQRRQEDRLPNVIHEEGENTGSCQRIELVI